MSKVKVVGQMVQAGEHRQTNGQMDGQTDATKRIISPASQSIMTSHRKTTVFDVS